MMRPIGSSLGASSQFSEVAPPAESEGLNKRTVVNVNLLFRRGRESKQASKQALAYRAGEACKSQVPAPR